ncbi:MAG: DNA polymerase IV [Candidatus Omnitrophota bacterium]
MILHIDMDAFFASIEQAINPYLKGKPLIVGSRNSKLHTVVCAASYEAKALGIDSGMPSFEAFKLCPSLEFVAAEQSKYIWTSEQIFEMLKEYGFEVFYASIDEFQMDTGDSPGAQELAGKIRESIYSTFNITASIGIAKNCLLAKLASKINKPNGICLLTEENLNQTLSKLPVEKLCGVGKSTAQVLTQLGINTCLDLYQKEADFLEEYLGKVGLNFHLSLHASESLKTNSIEEDKPKSIGHSYTLPWATENPGFIRAWIRLLSDMVAERLRQQDLGSQTAHLWLNSPEIGNFNCQKTFREPTDDGYEIYHRCLRIMAKMSLKSPKIRALGVTCSNLFSNSYSPLLKEEKRREALLKTIDRINACYGENTIYPAQVTLTRKMPKRLRTAS